MNWEDYGSENKDRVSETERMIRRDEVTARVAQDQTTRRKRERLAFGLTALLSTAVVGGVVLNSTKSSDRAVSTALRQFASNQRSEGVGGELFANPKIPDGCSIKCAGSDGIYRWADGERRAYPSDEVARSWDPEYDVNVHEVDCTDIPEGNPLSPKGELVAVVEAEQPSSIANTKGADPKPKERVHEDPEPAKSAEEVIEVIEDHAPLEYAGPETVEEVRGEETPVAVENPAPHAAPIEVVAVKKETTEPETAIENHDEVIEEIEPVVEYHHAVVEETAPVEEIAPVEEVEPVVEYHHAVVEETAPVEKEAAPVEEDKPVVEVVEVAATDAEVASTGDSTGEVVDTEAAVIAVVDETTGEVIDNKPAVIEVVETSEGDIVHQLIDESGDVMTVIEEAPAAAEESVEALPVADDASVFVEEEQQQPVGYTDSLVSYDRVANAVEIAQLVDATPDDGLMHIMNTIAEPVDNAVPEVLTEEKKPIVIEYAAPSNEELPATPDTAADAAPVEEIVEVEEVPLAESELVPEPDIDAVNEEDAVVIEVVDESTGLTEEHIVPIEDILAEPANEAVEDIPVEDEAVTEATSDAVEEEAPEIEVISEIHAVIEVQDEVTGGMEREPAVIVVIEESFGELVGEVINETTGELVGEVNLESPAEQPAEEQLVGISSLEEPVVEEKISLEEDALELIEEPVESVGAVSDTMIGYQPVLASMHIMHAPALLVDVVPEEAPVAPITVQEPEIIVYAAHHEAAESEALPVAVMEAPVEAHATATETKAQPEPVQVIVVHEGVEPIMAAEAVEEHPAVIETHPDVNTVEEVAEENHAAVEAVEPVAVEHVGPVDHEPAVLEHVEPVDHEPAVLEHVEPVGHEPVVEGVEVAATDAEVATEEHAVAAREEAAEETASAEEKPAIVVAESTEKHEPAAEVEQAVEHHDAAKETSVEVVEVPATGAEVFKEEEAAASHEVVESPAEAVIEEHANTEVATEAVEGEEYSIVADKAAPANDIHAIAVGELFGASEVDAKLIEEAIKAAEETKEERTAERETESTGSRRALRA